MSDVFVHHLVLIHATQMPALLGRALAGERFSQTLIQMCGNSLKWSREKRALCLFCDNEPGCFPEFIGGLVPVKDEDSSPTQSFVICPKCTAPLDTLMDRVVSRVRESGTNFFVLEEGRA